MHPRPVVIEDLSAADLDLGAAPLRRHLDVREALVGGLAQLDAKERGLLRIVLDARRVHGDGHLGRWTEADVRALAERWMPLAWSHADPPLGLVMEVTCVLVRLVGDHGLLADDSLDVGGVGATFVAVLTPDDAFTGVAPPEARSLKAGSRAWPFPFDGTDFPALQGRPLADLGSLAFDAGGDLDGWVDDFVLRIDDLRSLGAIRTGAAIGVFGSCAMAYAGAPVAVDHALDLAVDHVVTKLAHADPDEAAAWAGFTHAELVADGVLAHGPALELTDLGAHAVRLLLVRSGFAAGEWGLLTDLAAADLLHALPTLTFGDMVAEAQAWCRSHGAQGAHDLLRIALDDPQAATALHVFWVLAHGCEPAVPLVRALVDHPVLGLQARAWLQWVGADAVPPPAALDAEGLAVTLSALICQDPALVESYLGLLGPPRRRCEAIASLATVAWPQVDGILELLTELPVRRLAHAAEVAQRIRASAAA